MFQATDKNGKELFIDDIVEMNTGRIAIINTIVSEQEVVVVLTEKEESNVPIIVHPSTLLFMESLRERIIKCKEEFDYEKVLESAKVWLPKDKPAKRKKKSSQSEVELEQQEIQF